METQKDQLLKYAKEHGYDSFDFYMDNGYSGLNYDRPAFLRLEADIQAGSIGTVIVRNVDRFGRNIFENTYWVEQLRKNGITFIAADICRTAFRR